MVGRKPGAVCSVPDLSLLGYLSLIGGLPILGGRGPSTGTLMGTVFPGIGPWSSAGKSYGQAKGPCPSTPLWVITSHRRQGCSPPSQSNDPSSTGPGEVCRQRPVRTAVLSAFSSSGLGRSSQGQQPVHLRDDGPLLLTRTLSWLLTAYKTHSHISCSEEKHFSFLKSLETEKALLCACWGSLIYNLQNRRSPRPRSCLLRLRVSHRPAEHLPPNPCSIMS